MKNKKLLIIFAGVSFLISLLLLVPAKIVISQIESALPQAVMVKQVNGNLWQGQTRIEYQNVEIDVDWTFDLKSVLNLRPAFNVSAHSSSSFIETVVYPGLSNTRGDINTLLIDSPLIMTLVSKQLPAGVIVQTNGRISGDQIRFEVPNNGSIPLSLSGFIEWTGGNLQYQFGNVKGSSVLPKFYGQFVNDVDELDVRFELMEENGEVLMSAMLNQPTQENIVAGNGDITFAYEINKAIVPYLNQPQLTQSFGGMGTEFTLGKLEVSQ